MGGEKRRSGSRLELANVRYIRDGEHLTLGILRHRLREPREGTLEAEVGTERVGRLRDTKSMALYSKHRIATLSPIAGANNKSVRQYELLLVPR